MLMRDLDEWLSLAPDIVSGKVKAADKDKNTKRLHEILALPHIYPMLKGAGITADDTTKFTTADIDKVRRLRQSQPQPQWAALISDAGQDPKLIKLKLPQKYALNVVSLMAVGDHTLILATEGKSTGGYPQAQLLRVDESSGATTELTTYVGAPQTLLLDADEQNILLTYLPYDTKTKVLSDKLALRTIPIGDVANATEVELYPAVSDAFTATSDPKMFAIQSSVDHAIYFSKSGSSPEPLAYLLAPVDGMFLTTDGNHLVYAENGLLFTIDVRADAKSSDEWVPDSTFASYATEATAFLTKLGYQVPADVGFRWEDRDGFGSHEVTGLAVKKGGEGALLRYNVDSKRFESLFFPGTPWPNSKLPKASVDSTEAEKRANSMRLLAGWLSDKAEKYQPGPNPLYDGQTGTYVMIFHDGYLLKTPKGEKEAVNGEATLRVHKPTGQIVEWDLQTMPEIKTANFKASDNEIKSAVRNKGRQKYPENAAIKIDLADAALIVARNKKQAFAPAEIEEPGEWRLAWSVDTFIQPENELILTSWVDVENTDVLGELNFLPTSQSRQ